MGGLEKLPAPALISGEVDAAGLVKCGDLRDGGGGEERCADDKGGDEQAHNLSLEMDDDDAIEGFVAMVLSDSI